MTFAEYFLLLQRRWRVWVAGLILGLMAGAVVSTLAQTEYTATATSFVTVAERVDNSGQGEIFQGSQFAVQRVKSYAPLVGSPDVLQPVIDELGLTMSLRDLGQEVSVSSAPETVLLDVAATDPDPVLAARIADAVSLRLGQVIETLETAKGAGVSNVTVSLAKRASVPTQPSSPRIVLNLILGACVGLALGLVAAVLRQHLDKRIKTSEDVRALTDMSPLGSTIFERSARRRPLVALDWRSGAAERYRTVRTALKFATVDRELRHFVVTSAVSGEGKTSVACNLAISWAQSGAAVCLVEADLRRPEVAHFLGIDGSLGLSDLLVNEASIADVLLPWNHGMLTVLPAGALPPDPAALLGSAAMANLVVTLRDRFDVVIYDSPPILAVTDAAVLGHQVDGVVFVIRSGSTRRDQVAASVESLRRTRLTLLGSVLTGERIRGRRRAHEYKSELGPDRTELAPLVGSEAPPVRAAVAARDDDVPPAKEQHPAPGPDGRRRLQQLMLAAAPQEPEIQDARAWLRMAAGFGSDLRVDGVEAADVDVRLRMGADRSGSGEAIHLTVQPRLLPNSDRYFVDVRLEPQRNLLVTIGRHLGGLETRLRTDTVPGLVVEPGQLVQVRVQALGIAPTTLRAKVWPAGHPEPDAWTSTVIDDAAGLQRAGGVGLHSRPSGSATNAPVSGIFEDLWVGPTTA